MSETQAKSEIRQLVEQYAYALDVRDWDLLGRCFHPDAKYLLMDGAIVLNGPEAVVSTLSVVGGYKASQHSVANSHCVVQDGEATGKVHGTAVLYRAALSPGSVLVRGLRYEDRYVYYRDGWLFAARRHIPVWQYELPTLPPESLKIRPTAR